MQSKIIKGLYFCGEIIDLDGPCGGYNLQWSFSSGVLAGYGELRWEYDPITGSQGSNIDADSLIGGFQLGFKVPIDKKIDFNLNTKYLIHHYETYLNSGTASSKITHKYSASLGLGFIYSF